MSNITITESFIVKLTFVRYNVEKRGAGDSNLAIGLTTEPIGCARALYNITFYIFTFVSFIFLFFIFFFFFYQGSTENHFREWTP